MMRLILNAMAVVALIAASVTASAAFAAMSVVNPAFSQNLDARPKKVVLLPPQVFVFELSAGGVQTRMAEWEATARNNLTAAATRLAQDLGLFELMPIPSLAPADLDQLDAHIGLYDRVAQSVFVYGRGEQSAWAHKKNEFDYTVGPGLAFLREQAGADAALIVLGSDFMPCHPTYSRPHEILEPTMQYRYESGGAFVGLLWAVPLGLLLWALMILAIRRLCA